MLSHTPYWSIQPVVAGVQLGSSLFLTTLPMVVKERCVNISGDDALNSTLTDSWQSNMSTFYMTYKSLSQVLPVISGLFLAHLGDRGWRKSPIVVPLIGCILSRLVMVLMLMQDWSLEVLWIEVTIRGICGGLPVFWSNIMALLSLNSTQQDRSRLMMRAELTKGIAGAVGCVVSGHLFNLTPSGSRPGVLTMVVCLLLYACCVLYIVFLLQVGYGDASGFLIILSSFLSATVMSRWLSDLTLITVGMLSYAAGIFLMAFVTTTYMFYTARALTLFSLMPMPIIRSLLSQQVHDSSYGVVLTSLQLSLKVSSVLHLLLFIHIYQHTLNWFPGFVFIISGIITIVAVIPIRAVSGHTGTMLKCCNQRVHDEEAADEDVLLPLTNGDCEE
ncbi:uncharacterized protein V6R79_008068 [Siganus canaliculatus]